MDISASIYRVKLVKAKTKTKKTKNDLRCSQEKKRKSYSSAKKCGLAAHRPPRVNGGFANKKATTKNRLYSDKLKYVMAAKCHLIHIIEVIKYLLLRKIKDIQMPIIQLMYIICRSLIPTYIYFKTCYRFNYSRTTQEIKLGALKNIIDSVSLIEDMIKDIHDLYTDFSISTYNDITRIVKETKEKSYVETIKFISKIKREG
ncbi:hypothetical protein BDF21DRAFT_395955 [Thamnidium elegans]|nr:hypothetical protein BDF21DRAFT_395955 [Thamnidium elegans]